MIAPVKIKSATIELLLSELFFILSTIFNLGHYFPLRFDLAVIFMFELDLMQKRRATQKQYTRNHTLNTLRSSGSASQD